MYLICRISDRQPLYKGPSTLPNGLQPTGQEQLSKSKHLAWTFLEYVAPHDAGKVQNSTYLLGPNYFNLQQQPSEISRLCPILPFLLILKSEHMSLFCHNDLYNFNPISY